MNDGEKPSREERFDAIEQGTQVLVDTDGATFDYGVLPERAFENLLVISVGRSAEDVEFALRDVDVPLNHIGVIPVNVSTGDYDGPLWATDTVSPGDLTGLSIAFSQAYAHLKEATGWVVFDGIEIMPMYVGPDRLFRVLSSINQQCRQKQLTALFAVNTAAIDSAQLPKLTQIVDERIQY